MEKTWWHLPKDRSQGGIEPTVNQTHHMDPFESWRLQRVLPYVVGRLLDMGCGYNNLVRRHGSGVGVDVHPWPGVDVVIEDSACLPFADGSFDTVAMAATLNHIPNRADALLEARRVLRHDGRLIVTMIGPISGRIIHRLFSHDESTRGGMKPGEKLGMPQQEVRSLLVQAGFEITEERPFEFGLNRVYVATRRSGLPFRT